MNEFDLEKAKNRINELSELQVELAVNTAKQMEKLESELTSVVRGINKEMIELEVAAFGDTRANIIHKTNVDPVTGMTLEEITNKAIEAMKQLTACNKN